MLEGDALVVVKAIRSGEPSSYSSVIRMVNRMEVFSVSHIHREGNSCADWVTKWIWDGGDGVAAAEGFSCLLAEHCEGRVDWVWSLDGVMYGPEGLSASQKEKMYIDQINIIKIVVKPRNTKLKNEKFLEGEGEEMRDFLYISSSV